MARKSTDSLKRASYRWEDAEPEDAHSVFTTWADMVRDRPASANRRKRNILYASLYSNLPMLGFGLNGYTRSTPLQGAITLNVIQNAVDSLVAKVCKNRPRPQFTTVGAQADLQERLENCDDYIDGLFYQQEYYHTTFPGKVLDATIYGLGVTKVHEVDGECIIERVYPHEMILDDRECMYAKPSRIGQRKWYDSQDVWDLWSKTDDSKESKYFNSTLEDLLSGSSQSDPQYDDIDRDDTSDQVLVFEAWRKPGPKKSGKMLRCLRGLTLDFYDTKDESPWNFLVPERPHMGLWGIGTVEKIATIQKEINRIVQSIQASMHLLAKPHWMVEASSNVLATSLNNDIATIIKYQGATPPSVYVPQAMSPEVYQHLQFLIKQCFEISGISQLSAQSQKPAGLNTGVALRTYLNVESERFNNFVRATEESVSADAMKSAQVLGGMRSPPQVKSVNQKTGANEPQIEWNKVDLKNISVQLYPTSKLPDTPAGRREYALELAQYNIAGPDEIYEMLEWDDTEAFAKRRLAGRRNVERDIVRIRRGERVIRDAIGDHATALQIMTDGYEEAKHDGLQQSRLAVMRAYIYACRSFLNMPPLPGTEAPVPPPEGGGLPPGPGLLPPPGPVVPPNMAPGGPGSIPEAPLPAGPPLPQAMPLPPTQM